MKNSILMYKTSFGKTYNPKDPSGFILRQGGKTTHYTATDGAWIRVDHNEWPVGPRVSLKSRTLPSS